MANTKVNINGVDELDLNLPGSTSVSIANGVATIQNNLTGDVNTNNSGPPNSATVVSIQTTPIDSTAPLANQVLQYNATLAKWKAQKISYNYTAVSSTYSIVATDYQVECTSGTFTVTLPTAVGIQGTVYSIKNSGTGNITLATTASQTIDGQFTQLLIQGENFVVMSNGANWMVI